MSRISHFLALSLDPDGSIYAAGSATFGGNSTDTLLAKFSSSGQPRWSRRSSAAAGNSESLWGAATDMFGHVHVVGEGSITDNITGAVYDEYDRNGYRVRHDIYAGPLGGASVALAIAVDAQGNAHIAGTSATDTTGFDALGMRYDADALMRDGFESN